MDTYYLCNKNTGEVISIGPLPDAWENISGLSSVRYEDISDLSWAGHPGFGFLNEDDAKKFGVSPSIIDAQKLKASDVQWARVRSERDARILQVRWRIERHNDEVAKGDSPTENVMPLLEYVQKLRDITNQIDPFNINWPDYPG